jgi:predicted GIY-YIG superfamily endonuclease
MCFNVVKLKFTCKGKGMPHYVYKWYDKNKALLYVGCSKDPKNRERYHKIKSEWFEKAVYFFSERFDTKEEALAAEKSIIKKEKPAYNVHHNLGNTEPVKPPEISVKDAASFAGNKSELAKIFGVSRQAVTNWGEYLPPLRAYQLRDLGYGKARTITE